MYTGLIVTTPGVLLAVPMAYLAHRFVAVSRGPAMVRGGSPPERVMVGSRPDPEWLPPLPARRN